jgi:hypothetical protein
VNVSVESHGGGGDDDDDDDDDNDDDDWGKLPTRPPELSGNPTNRDIWERVEGMDEVRISHISNFDTSTDL